MSKQISHFRFLRILEQERIKRIDGKFIAFHNFLPLMCKWKISKRDLNNNLIQLKLRSQSVLKKRGAIYKHKWSDIDIHPLLLSRLSPPFFMSFFNFFPSLNDQILSSFISFHKLHSIIHQEDCYDCLTPEQNLKKKNEIRFLKYSDTRTHNS
jgi:hypothetical protein